MARAYGTKAAKVIEQYLGDPIESCFAEFDPDAAPRIDAKTIARRRIDAELGVCRAALEHDADGVHAGLAALGFFENERLPPNSLFASRMQGMTLAALGQLGATANWHRIMSEWLYGSPPGSSLGLAEAEYFAGPRAYVTR